MSNLVPRVFLFPTPSSLQPRSQGPLLAVPSLNPGDGKERTLGTMLRSLWGGEMKDPGNEVAHVTNGLAQQVATYPSCIMS